MVSNRIFWLVLAVTLGVYLTMVFWSIPFVSREAGELPVFDLRPGGYTFEEAKAFLAALSPEGTRFYADVQHRLDTAYPVLLAVTLAWAILRLAPASWGAWCWALAATAVPGMVFDYWENAGVAFMLEMGPDGITPAVVAAVSFHSRAKAALTTVSMSILLILLLRWVYRRWRAPHNSV